MKNGRQPYKPKVKPQPKAVQSPKDIEYRCFIGLWKWTKEVKP